MVLFITIVQAIYAFGVMFIACELGQRITLAFYECSDLIDQLEWYLFPNKIQRMLPIIMSFAQQSVEMKCFGSAACNRETFKYVSETTNPTIIQDDRLIHIFSGDKYGILILYDASSVL